MPGSLSRKTYYGVQMWRHKGTWAWMGLLLWALAKVPWLAQHWRGVLWAIVFVFWWSKLGLLAAVVLTGVSYWIWLTVRLRFRQRLSGASALTASDIREEDQNRATIRKQWPRACDRVGLADREGGDPPKLLQVKAVNPGTFTAAVDLADAALPVEDLEAKASKIASIMRCEEMIVKRGKPGMASVTFHYRDAIGRILPLADLPAPIPGRLTYGIHSDGSPATLELGQSLLMVGLPGSGKSTIAQACIVDSLRQGIPTRIYVADPKSQEFTEYRAHLGEQNGCLEVRQYAGTVAEGEAMFKRVLGAMETRAKSLGERGIRKWTPTPEDPHVIVIVDDGLSFVNTLKASSGSALAQIGARGRAAGFAVYLLAQVGTKQEMGAIRDILPQRVCLATRSPEATDVVLGRGATAAGAECHHLQGKPGVGYSFQEGDYRASKFRAAMVTDDDYRSIASGVLPPAVRRAMVEHEQRAVEAKLVAKKDRPGMLYRYWYVPDDYWLTHGWPNGVPTDRPAYIGKSVDAARRAGQHLGDDRDFTKGPHRFETQVFATEREAIAAEKAAILAEKPVHNDLHNRTNPFRKVDLRVDKRLSRRKEPVA